MITVPIVINVINSAQEQANRRSVDGLVRAGKYYSSESLFDTGKAEKIKSQENLIDEISYEGKGPETGQLYVNEHSDVALAVKYGDKCYKKEYEGNIETLDYHKESCLLNINIDRPEVHFTIEGNFNELGWSQENFTVTIDTVDYSTIGVKHIKWCGTSNQSCEPMTVVTGDKLVLPISQETGGSKICAISVDGFGNESEVTCSEYYKLDKTSPEFLGLIDIEINQDDILDLESGILLTDTLSGVEGTFTYNPTDVDRTKAGEYTITYSGKDLAGNIGTGSRKVTVHTSAPSISFTPESNKINNNGWSKENMYITINAIDYSSYGIEKLVWCGTASNTCTPTTEVNSANQSVLLQTESNNHHICAYAVDKFGQQGETTCSGAYKIDKTVPTFTGIEDITINVGETLDLTNGVSASDSLSGMNGTYSYAPTTIDTSKTGSYPVTYTVSDLAGNIKQITRNVIVNSNNPTINFTVASGAINGNGWAKANFYVTVNSTDYSGHGIEKIMWCGTTNNTCTPSTEVNGTSQNILISQENNNNRICAYAIDKGGHTGSTTCSDAYKLDKTAPTAGNATITGTTGDNGWYRSDVTLVKVDGSDSLSGHASTTISRTSVTGETSGTTVTITTKDNAGNTSTKNVTIKIDKTAPTISGLTNISVSRGGSVNLTSGVSASDSLSGMNGTFTYSPTSIDTSSAKTVTVTYTAKDKAGNVKTGTRTVNVTANKPTVTFTPTSGAINANGWAKSNFYVTVNSTDYSGHGISYIKWCGTTGSSCTPTTQVNASSASALISTESSTNKICAYAVDNYGQTRATSCSSVYKLDKTIPTAGTLNINGTLGSNSWYTSNVTLSVNNGSDTLSGHATTTTSHTSITTNTTGTTITVTTTDQAGNTATRTYTIKVDKNAPTLTAKASSYTITQGQSVTVSSYFNAPSYSISGGNWNCSPVSTSGLAIGTQTVGCTATGGNGLKKTASVSVIVKGAPVGIDLAITSTNFYLTYQKNGSGNIAELYQNTGRWNTSNLYSISGATNLKLAPTSTNFYLVYEQSGTGYIAEFYQNTGRWNTANLYSINGATNLELTITSTNYYLTYEQGGTGYIAEFYQNRGKWNISNLYSISGAKNLKLSPTEFNFYLTYEQNGTGYIAEFYQNTGRWNISNLYSISGATNLKLAPTKLNFYLTYEQSGTGYIAEFYQNTGRWNISNLSSISGATNLELMTTELNYYLTYEQNGIGYVAEFYQNTGRWYVKSFYSI